MLLVNKTTFFNVKLMHQNLQPTHRDPGFQDLPTCDSVVQEDEVFPEVLRARAVLGYTTDFRQHGSWDWGEDLEFLQWHKLLPIL